jgi:uncharacterized protein (DUF924 family)
LTNSAHQAAASPEEVVRFWQAAGPDRWFKRDDAFDAEVRSRFLGTYEAAARGDLRAWEAEAESALALTIVLDQFPRNLFRGDPRTYATDAFAREIADRAISRGFDQQVASELRTFFYLPFMHSEGLADQERCIELYRAANDVDSVKWAEHHAGIIRRFGRFPHRNRILGRATTPEEQAFLEIDPFGL